MVNSIQEFGIMVYFRELGEINFLKKIYTSKLVNEMKKIKNFYRFVINEDLKSEIIQKLKPERKEIKEFLIDRLFETIGSEDFDALIEFIDDYLTDSEKNKIETLSERSDIIEFWERFNNDIDEVLSDIKFFRESPSSLGCYSSYDYIETLTEKSIKQILMEIKEDLEKSEKE